ncbi:ABC transporter permease [Spirosoma arcticum]
MLRNYLKIALRNLRSQRSYTFINTVGLSVGMAGGLLIFLFLRHHLSTDRHHANYNRIVRIDTDLHLDDGSIEYNAEAPPPMSAALRTRYPQVEQAAFLLGWRDITVSSHRSTNPQPTRFFEQDGMGFVEPEWFDVLTYTWLQGDPKTALSAPNRVVLTQSWAKRYFGETNALGQTLTLDNKAIVTVTGVVADPPGPTDTELGLFISLPTVRQLVPTIDLTDWSLLNSANRLYARLKSPEAISSLQQAMPALSKQHYGESARIYKFQVQPMTELHFDVARDPAHTIRPALLWSLGVVGLLLILAACINFINLATAQALRRGKEVGIRKTLGSSRRQLIRQFLLETALITGAALGLGLLLVTILLPLFNDWVQLSLSLRFDSPTIAFVGLMLSSVVLLAGGYPAIVLSGFTPYMALRGKLTTTVGRGFTMKRVLVVTQFVVCQALIVGALVVANQIRYIQRSDLGFRQDNVVVVALPFDQKAKHDAFKQQLSSYADIRSVSLSVLPPSSSRGYGGSFIFNGKTDWELYPVLDRLADADYVSTYGIKLLAGRNITPGDTIRDYLINETLLHKLGFNNPQQVLGKTLQYYLSSIPLPIVGVVRDFHQKSMRDEIGPCIIANWAPWYRQAGIRISGNDPAQTLQHIRQTWQQLFPDEVFEYQFLNDQIAQLYQAETLTSRLINAFTGIAILICCLGLYGLVSHAVVQRTKEIGIRKVLGASVASIVALLSKDFLELVLIAIVIASPIAWYAMNRWLQDFAYKIDIEWWVFALAGLLAVGIALLTVSFQSIKAALMNPVTSLRSE